MTIELNDLLSSLLYVSLIILVIVLIVIGIKLIKTLNDVNKKMSKLNGIFDIIDITSDCAANLSSRLLKIFAIKKGKNIDE